MATPNFKDFDLNNLNYGSEVMTNKNTGAKSIYTSTQPGSNDSAHKVRFQMGIYDTDLLRAPFGVSKLMPSQDPNSTRRDLDLSIDSEDLLTFLRRLDEQNLEAAVQHSMDWWKKPLDKAVLRDRFKPIVKEPNKAEYRPTAKTKLIVGADRNNTQIFLVTKETPSTPETPGTIQEYVPITMADIPKGCKALAVVETNGLWLGANQFGMSLMVTHLLVWPTRQTRGIEAFAGLGTPRIGDSIPQPLPPRPSTNGGMYGGVVDDEMLADAI